MLFLILGPSGVGKGSIIAALKQKWASDNRFVFPITATTREPRPGEQNGKDYFFLSRLQFEHGIQNGDFLEYAMVHQNHYYGLPKNQVLDALAQKKIVIRELDIQGLHTLEKIIPKQDLFSLFVLPPTLEILEHRITSRSPLPAEEIARRLQTAKNEISHAHECTAQIVSEEGKLEQAVLQTVKYITPYLS